MNQSEDEQYLKLLSIFHYVVGGIAGLFACFPIIHFVVGLGMLISSFTQSSQNGPPALIGLFFTLFAGGFIVLGWAFASVSFSWGSFPKKKNVLHGYGWRQIVQSIWDCTRGVYDYYPYTSIGKIIRTQRTNK
jgi:hypothetical protein